MQFVWVERQDIDKDGIWLRVIKADDEGALCEFKDTFRPDVYIANENVVRVSSYEVW